MLDDMLSLGDAAYAALPLDVLLRIYRDMQRLLSEISQVGRRILQTIDEGD